MYYSSHRLRSEEKKLHKKIAISILLLIIFIITFIFVGLPILINFIIFISSFKKDNYSINVTDDSFLLPPVLNSISEATNSSPITISGFADKEIKVVIYVNDKEKLNLSTDNEGKFSSDKLILTEGENMITAKIVKDQKESNPSSPLRIQLIKDAPKLDILNPKDGEKFDSDQKEISIIGETGAGNKVYINDRVVIVDTQGKFSYKVKLSDGENIFKISAFDIAGNKTEKEIKVTYGM